MLDDQLSILWRNESCAALIAAREGLESRGGTLSTVDRSQQAGLRTFVLASNAALSTWSLSRGDGGGLLLFHAVRPGEGRVVGVSLQRAGSDFTPHYRELDRAFRLTVAEHRVLLSLLAGNDAEMLARLHGVSIETTRSHIRSIYLKLGVNSRERLFALAQAFRL